jgi:hypothetical protein
MTVQIGQKTFATRRPDDLDNRLLAEFGCNAAEVARLLSGSPLAGTVARALLPFVTEADRPETAVLATAIEAAGVAAVAAQVLATYARAGADDLDGMSGKQLDQVAADETISLTGAKTLDDKRSLIRAARQERLAAASEAV